MKKIIIHEDDSSQRLDKFLKKIFSKAPLSFIYKIIRKKFIKINGTKKNINYILNSGDEIVFYLSEEIFLEFWYPEFLENLKFKGQKKNKTAHGLKKHIFSKHNILFEDEDMLVYNKDAGMLVHPGDFKETHLSLITHIQDYLLLKNTPVWLAPLTFKPSLVHRLDKDTSGCVLIAKTKYALDVLTKNFREREIKKTYLAVCQGNPPKKSFSCDAKLRVIQEENQKQVRVSCGLDAQEAFTDFQVLIQDKEKKHFLCTCFPRTGRMHQIRVHLVYQWFPILGDKKYGNIAQNNFFKRKYSLERHLLHAHSIEFLHPRTKKKFFIKAPLKLDMKIILDTLFPSSSSLF